MRKSLSNIQEISFPKGPVTPNGTIRDAQKIGDVTSTWNMLKLYKTLLSRRSIRLCSSLFIAPCKRAWRSSHWLGRKTLISPITTAIYIFWLRTFWGRLSCVTGFRLIRKYNYIHAHFMIWTLISHFLRKSVLHRRDTQKSSLYFFSS